jgi:hypothetical protein
MLKRMAIAIALCAMSAPMMRAQTKTIDDGACHVTVPADWKLNSAIHMADAPGPGTFRALVKTIDARHYDLTMEMVKSRQMASLNAKILDENAKRVLIQTELKMGNKTTTHYQLMTKGSPACQGIVDFDNPAMAEQARKIVESTTGAK